MTIPQSNDSPEATVCTAPRADEPDDAGRPPPEEREPLLRAGDDVTAAAEEAEPDAAPTEESGADEAPIDDAEPETSAEDTGAEGAAAEETTTLDKLELLLYGNLGAPLNTGAARELPLLGTGAIERLEASVGIGTDCEPMGNGAMLDPPGPPEGHGGPCGRADAPSANAKSATEMYCILLLRSLVVDEAKPRFFLIKRRYSERV